jgi:uncharacterized membrane protein YfcA
VDAPAARKADFSHEPAIPLKWQGVVGLASLLAPLSLWIFHSDSAGVDADSIVMFTAAFFGAVVVGAAGFGSAAVGGAIMLFWFVPLSAIPILNAASLTTQTISMGQLWRSLSLRNSMPLIVGGLFGIPLGAWVLRVADPNIFHIAFGAFLLIWSLYLLLRPLRLRKGGPLIDGLVGVTGGFTGGAIAFPAAFPAIWCALTRVTKEEQRGTMQIYILVMQCCVLAYLYFIGIIGPDFPADYLKIFPAIIIGTFVGVFLYSRINETTFRRTVLLILLVASVIHITRGLAHFIGVGPGLV